MIRRYISMTIFGLVSLFLMHACAEAEIDDQSRSYGPSGTDAVVGDNVEQVPETMITELYVELDEETADYFCEHPGEVTLPGINGVTYERLIPDAGEWEPRHRKAGLHRLFKVTFESKVSEKVAVATFNSVPEVTMVEVPQAKQVLGIPFNDPYRNTQWQYYNGGTAMTGFVKGCDINVVPVWENYTGGTSNVIVSVVDQGIQINHPDLNGVVLAGGSNGSKNFTDNSYNITQSGSHGCHVAGTIGAINNNGKGLCGVAGGLDGNGGVTLMSCQIFGSQSGNSANAIIWGADHGAVISQNSWGYNYDANDDGQLTGNELTNAMNATIGYSDKKAVDYFIQYAGCDSNGNQKADSPMKGGIVIFAAGNDNIGNGAPANYEKVLAVGALGPDGKRASYSNYGSWVDICAPGGEASRFSSNAKAFIYSCGASSSYTYMCGTSMACPHVSGVAALVVSYFGGQGFTNTQLWNMLIDNANSSIVTTNSSYNIGPLVDAYAIFEANANKNAAPQITTTYTGNYEVIVGQSLSVDYVITDADGDECTMTITGDGSATLQKTATNKYRLTINGVSTNIGTHKATLTAKDPKDAEATLEITYKIFENHTPVISTTYTGNYKARIGETLSINYKVTDEDGDSCTMTLSGDGSATLTKTGTNACTVKVTTTAANVGSHKATLKADDGKGGVAELEISYSVLANNAPLIEATNTFDHEMPVGSDVSATFKATDPDDDAITFSLSGDGSAVLFTGSNNTCTISFQTSQRFIGEHTATLTAKDATGASSSETINYKIYINYPPVITTAYTGDYSGLVGETLSVDFTITDANGDNLTVTYDNDGSSSLVKSSATEYRVVFNLTAANAGSHTSTIKADDGKGGVATFPISYKIINNHAPTVTLKGSYEKEIAVGQNLQALYTVADQDNDELKVTLTADGSAELVNNGNAEYAVKFLPKTSNVGNHTATIEAVDPYGAKASASLTYKTYINQAPVITRTYTGPTTLKWYEQYSASFSAKDPEGKTPLKFEVTSSNAVSTPKVNGTSATVNIGDGKGSFSGDCTITVTAEDVLGLKATEKLTYTVLANRAPELKKQPVERVFTIVGEKFNMDMESYWTDPDDEKMTYTCTSDNPEAISVSGETSIFTVRALKTGGANVTITAKDGLGAVSSKSFRVGMYDDSVGPTVYPNPVVDYLNIKIGEEQTVTLKLYSELNALVKEVSAVASIFEPMKIDLTDLAPGRYTAKITVGSKAYEKKIVKR